MECKTATLNKIELTQYSPAGSCFSIKMKLSIERNNEKDSIELISIGENEQKANRAMKRIFKENICLTK